MKTFDVSYLGPAGTFTHEATVGLFGTSEQLVPLSTIPLVLDAVSKGASTFGVVPIENSIQGEVTTTMDALIFDYDHIYVTGEYVVPVTFSAFQNATDYSLPTAVISHPHAIAQCRRYIERLGVAVRTANSTAHACEIVSQNTEPGLIAIGSKAAGELYSLRTLENQIEDFPGAATKFYSIGRSISPPSGNDKTLLVLNPLSHAPGVLSKCLDTFTEKSLNLFSIHSRTLRAELGTYAFVLVVQGHIGDNRLQTAISGLLMDRVLVKFVGSFAAWQKALPTSPAVDISGIASSPSEMKKWLEVIAHRDSV